MERRFGQTHPHLLRLGRFGVALQPLSSRRRGVVETLIRQQAVHPINRARPGDDRQQEQGDRDEQETGRGASHAGASVNTVRDRWARGLYCGLVAPTFGGRRAPPNQA